MEQEKKVATLQLIAHGLWGALTYSIVEVSILVCFLWQRMFGDGLIDTGLLWFTFVLATVWVLLTSSEAAYEEAREIVLYRDLYPHDFLMSAFVFCVLGLLANPQGWQFCGIFLIAAGQNIRYTYASLQWLLEDSRDRDQRKRTDTDNNVP